MTLDTFSDFLSSFSLILGMLIINLIVKPTIMNHIELGQHGEKIAANQLITKGYKIICKNYRLKNAEIDIVCTKGNKLIVVEVKTRNSTVFGEPYLSITRAKQKKIIRVTNKFIEEKEIDLEVRFDVISIVINKNKMRLEHIEDAFYPLI